MYDVVQILGSLTILAAFVASLSGRVRNGSYRYLAANALGSAALTSTPVVRLEWGFIRSKASGHWSLLLDRAEVRQPRQPPARQPLTAMSGLLPRLSPAATSCRVGEDGSPRDASDLATCLLPVITAVPIVRRRPPQPFPSAKGQQVAPGDPASRPFGGRHRNSRTPGRAERRGATTVEGADIPRCGGGESGR